MEDFDAALSRFIDGCQTISDSYYGTTFPKLTPSVIKLAKGGRRYAKLTVTSDGDAGQTSVHCFVDTTNGDVLKAAGWTGPAKHARGNVFDDKNGLGAMGPYGPAYLKGGGR